MRRLSVRSLFPLLLAISSIVYITSCMEKTRPGSSHRTQVSREDIIPGLALSDFNRVFPELKPDAVDQIQIREKVHGLDGVRTYSFSKKRLSWAVFNSYHDSIDEQTFYSCMNAVKEISEELSDTYGKPAQVQQGITVFKDPATDPHWGYPVYQGEWNTDYGKCLLSFQFLGEKTEPYRFLVSLEYRGI